MLLSDTVECPACKYVLDESRYEQWQADAQDLSSNVVEDRCRHCGESVRRGLVRCWNCGEFMREEIAAAYQQMQSSPQPVVYSPLPDASAAGAGVLRLQTSADTETTTATDEDFELGDQYRLQQPTETAHSSTQTPTQPSTPQSPPDSQGEASPSPPSEGATEDESGAASAEDASAETETPHSEATGGDVLLNIARAEEAELRRRKRQQKKRRLTQPRSAGAILLYCPNGHRIEVAERYRGMTGRCPKCRSPFIVPPKSEEQTDDAEATAEGQEPTEETGIGKYTHWMQDVHVHAVNPERLRLKPGSLESDFQLYDVGFAEDEILIVTLAKRKGAAGATSKKRLDDREKLFDYLRNDGPLADLPAEGHFTLNADQAKSISVTQPPLYPHESLFADVPVFGEGRIAVRLLIEDDPKIRHFASFTLSRFREFAHIVNELYGVEGLGEDVDVPLTDSYVEAKCHYSEQPVKFLENIEYYQADPDIELTLVGRKCQACGLVISEDSRKKEKIGGVNGKTIAKAKCPKCQQKLGTLSLFTLAEPESPAADSETDGETTPAAQTATSE